MPLLELDSLAAGYGRVEAIEALTLHVENGEIVALLGANGAGKSTTLRAIAGLLKPRKGTIRFDGRSIEGMAPEAIVRLGIALVPEGRRIFPGRSACPPARARCRAGRSLPAPSPRSSGHRSGSCPSAASAGPQSPAASSICRPRSRQAARRFRRFRHGA